jgi:hypothetical protein
MAKRDYDSAPVSDTLGPIDIIHALAGDLDALRAGMSRTPARVTQADVARCVRAALAAGAGPVEVRPDGTLLIHMTGIASGAIAPAAVEKELEDTGEVVL